MILAGLGRVAPPPPNCVGLRALTAPGAGHLRGLIVQNSFTEVGLLDPLGWWWCWWFGEVRGGVFGRGGQRRWRFLWIQNVRSGPTW